MFHISAEQTQHTTKKIIIIGITRQITMNESADERIHKNMIHRVDFWAHKRKENKNQQRKWKQRTDQYTQKIERIERGQKKEHAAYMLRFISYSFWEAWLLFQKWARATTKQNIVTNVIYWERSASIFFVRLWLLFNTAPFRSYFKATEWEMH